VPEGLVARILLRQSFTAGRRGRAPRVVLAAALVSVGVVAGLFFSAPGDERLAREVLAHVEEQPHYPERAPGEEAMTVDAALAAIGAERTGVLGETLAANACAMGGRTVAHLVVAGERGAVAVVLVPGRRVASAKRFADDERAAMLVPVEGGTLAVVGAGEEPLEALAVRMRGAVSWQL